MNDHAWLPYLHNDLTNFYVLFPSLRVYNAFTFLSAALLSVVICWMERYLTYVLDGLKYPPAYLYGDGALQRARMRIVITRCVLYYAVTLLRLLYMLITMSLHTGLLLVVVTSLTSAQFVVEYAKSKPRKQSQRRQSIQTPVDPPQDVYVLHDDEAEDAVPLQELKQED